MNFDEMLEAWRAQDERPPYRVNPDLLRVVVQHEYAEVRRVSGWEHSFVPWALWAAAGAMLVVVFALLFAVTSRGWVTLSTWDYLATGVATGAMLIWPAVYWASYKQLSNERGSGDPLQEDIRRSLSRVDYELSRHGRLAPSLLLIAPFAIVAILFFWITARTDEGPIQARLTFFIVAFSMFSPLVWTRHYVKEQLLAQRRRLSQLLELLNVSESFPSRPD
jgi:hypothetical protein